MNRHVKAAIILLLAGLVSIIGAKYLLPLLADKQSTATSDAKDTKGHINIGVDNFIGYFPLCSPEMSKRLRQAGYLLTCHDDGADYSQRIARLAKGELDFAVATVDSYVLNGQAESYPGTIIAVLDESKGSDALVAWQDKLASLDGLRQNDRFTISYTPDSPSHHLLKALAVHFDIEQLKTAKGWQVEADGSEAALSKFLSRQVDAAVLWEPDVSRALAEKGAVKILGTEKTQQLIVDILVAHRPFAQKKPEVVALLLKEYFKTLKYYRQNPDKLSEHIRQATDLSDSQISDMLQGIEWQSLSDNAEKWFGVSRSQGLANEALIDTIESTLEVLIEYTSLSANPLPNRDPYRITNSQFISELFQDLLQSSGFGVKPSSSALVFAPLDTAQWQSLKEIGTLKVRPILFSSGSDNLTLEGKTQLDLAVENLKHYPAFRIEVRGHTATRGDQQANLQLSQERADAVMRYLEITHDIATNRIRAVGFGGSKPLAQMANESSRAYHYRLPRVELVLMGEDF